MSRVGKKPITIPSSVSVAVQDQTVHVKGPKGELACDFNPRISVKVDDGEVTLARPNDQKSTRALHGLYRALINNMVTGVTSGFEKKLEIVGVGFKAEIKSKRLVMQIGFSHPIVFVPPDGVEIGVDGTTQIKVSGIDKELVGQVAAKIRSCRPPEPYKGKGIRYENEHVRRKAGKTAS